MLLTITTTRAPATDLGYLLHKHPDRVQSFAVAAGHGARLLPRGGAERCTAALLLEVDPIGLVRDRKGAGKDFALGQYVNDRPYAASSLLAVAIKEAFRTALTGRCDARPEPGRRAASRWSWVSRRCAAAAAGPSRSALRPARLDVEARRPSRSTPARVGRLPVPRTCG